MFDRLCANSALKKAAERLAPAQPVHLTGVWGSSAAILSAILGKLSGRPVLFISPHLDDADAAADDIELATGQPVSLFPAWEVQMAGEHPSEEVTSQRLAVLNALMGNERPEVIVAPIMALLQPVPTPEALEQNRLSLKRGDALDPEALMTWLIQAGYEHVEQVDQQGDCARRGGIVDIFPPASQKAVRAEFFGDELESLRTIDLDTQRSTEELQSAEITAMRLCQELRGNDEQTVTHLLDYLPAGTVIVMLESTDLRDLAQEIYDRTRDDTAPADSPVAMRRIEDIFVAADHFARAEMHLFGRRQTDNAVIHLGIRSLERLTINTAEALEELSELAQIADVEIYCETAAEKDHFAKTLAERHPTLAEKAHLHIGHLTAGFYWPEAKLAAVGHHEIFHRYAKVRRIRRVRTGRPIQSLLDLAEGDYVVHVGHGIAKFDGLRMMDRQGVQEEYLRLKFKDNAVLHVPAGQINLVQKYIGAKGKRPNLSKLGGGHWARTREKVSQAVEDLAAEMLRIQAMRGRMEGTSYPRTSPLQDQFAEEFLYTETEDQLSAIAQTSEDLFRKSPMDRLICGDVGYGKTEIAMRAAMKVVEAGRQAAILCPTTVLADQHLRTFHERFADFPVQVDMISRFRTPKQIAETLRQTAAGQVDILIGTHRILSKDVNFANLGLVIIDEEQRFGVAAKEHLKHMRSMIDVLTLTATPIPRTLHMSLLGLRDISSLQTPPMDRRAIHTEVTPKDDDLIRSAIQRELNRNGQVFFVHNRVQDIQAVARHIQMLVPKARLDIGHGQMSRRDLERVMLRFVRGELDVLVCTTIVESGLDIPTANTMIIHEADRFGLAELHQLRGRVGRYKHRAFCYLLLPERRTVNPIAARRLKAIEDFSDLGAGFQIAMRDLEIRGAGNILGAQQSGHIAAVGYELYCQLLEQTVRQLKGEVSEPLPQVHIELGVEALLPKTYIPSGRQRMEIYRRLVTCRDVRDIEQLRADLADAYGQPEARVETLLDVSELRVLMAQMGVESVFVHGPDVIFRVTDHKKAEPFFQQLRQVAGATLRLPDHHNVYFRPPKVFLEPPTLLRVLIRRARQGTDLDAAESPPKHNPTPKK